MKNNNRSKKQWFYPVLSQGLIQNTSRTKQGAVPNSSKTTDAEATAKLILNRASEIKDQNPCISLPTAVIMAQREIAPIE